MKESLIVQFRVVMINGTVKKCELKKKTPDLIGNLCGKKPWAEEKVLL